MAGQSPVQLFFSVPGFSLHALCHAHWASLDIVSILACSEEVYQALAKPSCSLNRRMSVMCTLIKNRFLQPFHLIKHSECCLQKWLRKKPLPCQEMAPASADLCLRLSVHWHPVISPILVSSTGCRWFIMSQGWWLSAKGSLGPGRVELQLDSQEPASGKMYTQRKHTDHYLQTAPHSILSFFGAHVPSSMWQSLLPHHLHPIIFPK